MSDARAFLATATYGSFNIANAHLVLATDAYRKGDLAAAGSEWAAVAKLAEDDHRTFETSDLGARAEQGLAAIAQAHGDLQGALQALLKGADLVCRQDLKAVCLYHAADLAKQIGDDTTRNQIIARMAAEVPGSHLTTKLVGRDLLPVREP